PAGRARSLATGAQRRERLARRHRLAHAHVEDAHAPGQAGARDDGLLRRGRRSRGGLRPAQLLLARGDEAGLRGLRGGLRALEALLRTFIISARTSQFALRRLARSDERLKPTYFDFGAHDLGPRRLDLGLRRAE